MGAVQLIPPCSELLIRMLIIILLLKPQTLIRATEDAFSSFRSSFSLDGLNWPLLGDKMRLSHWPLFWHPRDSQLSVSASTFTITKALFLAYTTVSEPHYHLAKMLLSSRSVGTCPYCVTEDTRDGQTPNVSACGPPRSVLSISETAKPSLALGERRKMSVVNFQKF